ncbi:hypothetical protein C8J57DRAFT_1536666 [Mycena rebaudengoi]|nr:hypothetical protein C8J57DRAFT_1536666 [Mycena rebaudengoi]
MFHKLFTTALLALFVLGQVAESATLQDRAAFQLGAVRPPDPPAAEECEFK